MKKRDDRQPWSRELEREHERVIPQRRWDKDTGTMREKVTMSETQKGGVGGWGGWALTDAKLVHWVSPVLQHLSLFLLPWWLWTPQVMEGERLRLGRCVEWPDTGPQHHWHRCPCLGGDDSCCSVQLSGCAVFAVNEKQPPNNSPG